jgi:outer membrane beta-barrel protein
MRAALVCLALLAPAPAFAQLEFEADKPRVFSIQPRPYRLGHEFQLGLGILPLDAFYVGAVVGASYTYHFTDFWAWEIAGAGYSLNFDTGLKGELDDKFRAIPVRGGGEQIRLFGGTGLVVKPLFGKLAIFNSDVIYSETFFNLGLGPFLKGEFWRFAVNFGIGLRFWSSDVLSVRVDIRDYLVFVDALPENAFFLMLSASFNVNDNPPPLPSEEELQ